MGHSGFNDPGTSTNRDLIVGLWLFSLWAVYMHTFVERSRRVLGPVLLFS